MKMRKILFTLVALFCCTLMVATFTSCGSDDDDTDTGGPYNYEVKVDCSSIVEAVQVKTIFLYDYGVSGYNYIVGDNDSEVYTKCKNAESKFKADTDDMTNAFTLTVTNQQTNKQVYKYSNNK